MVGFLRRNKAESWAKGVDKEIIGQGGGDCGVLQYTASYLGVNMFGRSDLK